MGSDGLTIDSDGNLYLVGNGVTVFDKTGGKSEIFLSLKVGLPIYVSEAKISKVCISPQAKDCTESG